MGGVGSALIRRMPETYLFYNLYLLYLRFILLHFELAKSWETLNCPYAVGLSKENIWLDDLMRYLLQGAQIDAVRYMSTVFPWRVLTEERQIENCAYASWLLPTFFTT
ncbi:hypothetical protein Y032_0195g1481 [Ancylostoma ceylanicum]|uniref:Uncharacterized protein n=1 Tax=Ancylostoma ceylanicum TaxID=53326 RepID=A0A016SPM7_9BILA|nr:hypothetical protein Y032_0195g1481 [Ancylostoma ceylanicum]